MSARNVSMRALNSGSRQACWNSRRNPAGDSTAAARSPSMLASVNPPTGCRFNPRCPYAEDNCKVDEPQLAEVRPGHFVACHYWDEIERGSKRVTNQTEIVRDASGEEIPLEALHQPNGVSRN